MLVVMARMLSPLVNMDKFLEIIELYPASFTKRKSSKSMGGTRWIFYGKSLKKNRKWQLRNLKL